MNRLGQAGIRVPNWLSSNSKMKPSMAPPWETQLSLFPWADGCLCNVSIIRLIPVPSGILNDDRWLLPSCEGQAAEPATFGCFKPENILRCSVLSLRMRHFLRFLRGLFVGTPRQTDGHERAALREKRWYPEL